MEEKFQIVKEYIRENKGVGMREVSEACDVEMAQIQQWLREERLEVTEDSAIFITCESCGANIRSGKYCDSCKAAMTNGFNNILNANKPKQEPIRPSRDKDNPKMRFLN
jgi:methionyl-tRNA synthetase